MKLEQNKERVEFTFDNIISEKFPFLCTYTIPNSCLLELPYVNISRKKKTLIYWLSFPRCIALSLYHSCIHYLVYCVSCIFKNVLKISQTYLLSFYFSCEFCVKKKAIKELLPWIRTLLFWIIDMYVDWMKMCLVLLFPNNNSHTTIDVFSLIFILFFFVRFRFKNHNIERKNHESCQLCNC